MRATLVLVLVLCPLVGCGDFLPPSESPEPYDRWIGKWQGRIDDASRFHDWDTDYLYIFKAGGDFEIRHIKSSDLLLVGSITVTEAEFTLILQDERYGIATVSGTWTITGKYLYLSYRMNGERESRLKWYP